MKKFVILMGLLFSTHSYADDPWISCLQYHAGICAAAGDSYSFFVCNDWTGEDEACIRCTNGVITTRFAGCGSPDFIALPNNRKNPTCSSLKRGFSTIDQTTRSYSEEVAIAGTVLKLV